MKEKSNDCGKVFSQKHDLKGHIESVHEEKKPFQCDVCGARFSENK